MKKLVILFFFATLACKAQIVTGTMPIGTTDYPTNPNATNSIVPTPCN